MKLQNLTANEDKEIVLYTDTLQDINILRESLEGIKQKLMDSLKDIKNGLCFQDASYVDF